MSFKETILLQKRYFDIGYGTTSYVRLFVGIFGISSAVDGNPLITVFLALMYALFCYAFGWAFVKYGWYTVDIEIGNKFNLFVREMRTKIK